MQKNRHETYLEALPEDWDQARLDRIGNICTGTTPSRNNPSFWNGTVAWVTPGEVTSLHDKWLRSTSDLITDEALRYTPLSIFPTGTLLVTSRATIGEVSIAAIPITTNQGFKSVVLHPNHDPEFFYYALKLIAPEMRRLASGSTFDEISRHDFSAIVVPRPEYDEQRAIAAILDTADEAIRHTETLIAKLKQMRAGLLHDLLTYGIDENGELRDPVAHPEQFKESELGLIPRGWEVLPLGEVADLQVGYAFKSQWFREDEGIKLLRGENVGYGSPDWSETRHLPLEMYQQFKEYELCPGDIVIGMDRTFTKSGFKISTLTDQDIPALLVQRVGRFLPNCELSFLRALLYSHQYLSGLLRQQKGMDIPHLSKSEILEPLIALPSAIQEQLRIGQIVYAHDHCLSVEQEALEKLRLLKQGLMDDLLTGRVRVAGLAGA